MGNKIRVLSELTINQIAAGEVIENPASVVKELVENAVDAGATQVCVEIMSGGFQSIRISDDGCGMTAADAALCFQRHATSKIITADDLFALMTMGFRGEALASIAAIAQVTLTTKSRDDEAVQIEVEGGKIVKMAPVARNKGTTIEVRSLFYNVPARKKFQKSASASSAEITKMMTHLSLAHPRVGFELTQQQRSQFSVSALCGTEMLSQRAESLLGSEFTEGAYQVNEVSEEINIQGWIARPLSSRHNRSGQYLYINQRPVICPAIAYAVRDAYGTRISPDRHPAFLLHITLDPESIDVNVHPQKKEVRLKEESLLKYRLQSAIQQALEGRPQDDPLMTEKSVAFSAWTPPDWSFREPSAYSPASQPSFVLREEPRQLQLPLQIRIKPLSMIGHYLLVDASTLPESGTGIVFFDLPAVTACIWYEGLSQDVTFSSQQLLLPLTISVAKAEAARLREEVSLLQQLGISIHPISDEAFLVEALPPFIDESQLIELLHDMLIESQQLEKRGGDPAQKVMSLANYLMHSKRRRKKIYQIDEALQLVESLFQLGNPFLCPRGKYTFFHMGEDEISKKFM